jgi:hypothetical protein
MAGHYWPTSTRGPGGDEVYRSAETKGRPDFPASVALTARAADLAVYMEDMRHRMEVGGSIDIRLPDDTSVCTRPCTGYLELPAARRKPYGLEPTDARYAAQRHFTGEYTTIPGRTAKRETRHMRYWLELQDNAKRHWVIRGKKRIKDDPGLDAWRDTSSLFFTLLGPFENSPASASRSGE